MPRYDAHRIEPKWQTYWSDNKTFQVDGFDDSKDKLYILDMFPYPSGSGLHVGHPEGYTATDIVCRFSRMQGKQVLHPMGWDAFGLPAEDHAIKTGTHPAITTEKNIGTFRRQLKMLGFSYDWSREFATTDQDYYRWTQWIFLTLFDTWYDAEFEWTGQDGQTRIGKGRPISELPIPDEVAANGEAAVRRYQDEQRLAYQHEAPVNWCQGLGTVIANEEVIDGKSERGGHPVERIPLRQWMLRITSYADRLLHELDDLNWPHSIKEMQRNWIGRSTGAEVDFYIGGEANAEGRGDLESQFEEWKTARSKSGFPAKVDDDALRIYTTRPDTLFGATYMVLSPEHPFVERLTTPEQQDGVDDYVKKAALKSDLDRTDLAKGKTGVFTGSHAINPVTGEKIPIWVADYVLISYGTGAIMAVPGQDERDWEFAEVFDLPILRTVEPTEGFDGKAFAGDGPAINSQFLDGLQVTEAKAKMQEFLDGEGTGNTAVNYRLRDWLFSRQRYWGEPFPIWHELDADGNPTGLLRADDDTDLPIVLPDMENFQPTGTPEPLLSKAPDEWLYKTAADGTRLKRETNTMPQWAGSCWYYLRFVDSKNTDRFIDPQLEKRWLPVDLYVGGAEHAVLHLLYSRFWHKVLFDRGYVSNVEPFQRLVNQGMILGEVEYTGYKESGSWITSKLVQESKDDAKVRVNNKTGESVDASKVVADQVTKKGDDFVLVDDHSIVVSGRAHKMSKSRGNVINPDDVVSQYGADSLRMYEMFMGPLEQVKPWSMSGVEGVYRFLARVWRMITDEKADEIKLHPAVQEAEPNEDQERLIHKTIKAVTEDIEKHSFNTAISRMMEFTNAMTNQDVRPKSLLESLVLLLSPFAPHVAEELWEILGHESTLAYETWPTFDESKIAEAEIEVPVQINGKVRFRVNVPAECDKDTLEAAASKAAAEQIEGKTVVKAIVVPGRMVNFVVR